MFLREKMDLFPFLVQFFLSEHKMGFSYIDNNFDHKNPLY